MKVYVLVNQYMMGIQAGIQALHAVSHMWVLHHQTKSYDLVKWQDWHKTVILLNGGGHNQLFNYYNDIKELEFSNHYGLAREDDGLNNAITAVAVLADPNHPYYTQLMDLIKDLPLKH